MAGAGAHTEGALEIQGTSSVEKILLVPMVAGFRLSLAL